MSDKARKNWMRCAFVAFAFCSMELYSGVNGGITGPAHPVGWGLHRLGAQMLWLPVMLVLMGFSMDAFALGLDRSRWSGWGALGFAAACFLAQAVVVLAACQFFPLLILLLPTPWLVRRAMDGQPVIARILPTKAS